MAPLGHEPYDAPRTIVLPRSLGMQSRAWEAMAEGADKSPAAELETISTGEYPRIQAR